MDAADRGWALLSRIVQYDAVREAGARKIVPEMFPTQAQRDVYAFMLKYVEKYKQLPSLGLLAKKFPKAQLSLTVGEPTAYYLDQFLDQYLRAHGMEMFLRHAESFKDDPMKVLLEVENESRRLRGAAEVGESALGSETWRDVYDWYRKKERGEVVSIMTPFDTLNKMTGGFQNGDYTVITARPSVGKTWFAMMLAHHARKLNKKVLFFSKEMDQLRIKQREASLITGLPHTAIVQGELTPGQRKKLFKGLRHNARLIENGEFGEIVYGDPGFALSVIEAQSELHEPDLIVLDGLYLISDSSKGDSKMWEQVTYISRQIRSLALRINRPFLVTTQIHRLHGKEERSLRSATLADLAYSDAIGQDAVNVVMLVREQSAVQQMLVRGLKARDAQLLDFLVNWDLNDVSNVAEIKLKHGAKQDADDTDDEDEKVIDLT